MTDEPGKNDKPPSWSLGLVALGLIIGSMVHSMIATMLALPVYAGIYQEELAGTENILRLYGAIFVSYALVGLPLLRFALKRGAKPTVWTIMLTGALTGAVIVVAYITTSLLFQFDDAVFSDDIKFTLSTALLSAFATWLIGKMF